MSDGPTEEELRKHPMTVEGFNQESRSAHAWWLWELKPDCHPDAGLKLVVHGFNGPVPNAQMWTHCRECDRLTGVIEIARKEKKADEPAHV
jgi:hypothetical protein